MEKIKYCIWKVFYPLPYFVHSYLLFTKNHSFYPIQWKKTFKKKGVNDYSGKYTPLIKFLSLINQFTFITRSFWKIYMFKEFLGDKKKPPLFRRKIYSKVFYWFSIFIFKVEDTQFEYKICLLILFGSKY